MIHVFCSQRGTGKTKSLIKLANAKAEKAKGTVIYIDDDKGPMFNLDSRIRMIITDDFKLKDYNEMYGFLCGILSEDYDIETIFIDSLCNIISGNLEDAAHLFLKMEKLAHNYKLEFYININADYSEIPLFLQKYAA
ncbi:hypothetical protein [Clostridium algidicarnis]|uniref:Twitching motility protein PilT n=2 Tax=Clostridium algidicarnis TaxID=37659 RepID=A0A2S6G000_9CLOT|nr:hypothetical protein [Clostridium algidicarnis]MBB6630866.1 hypothetical protein [Clostridium algidicarnis]MBB6696769.1 hypothetical protein [Clostridium algidicarnis]MBU3192716.1 hypothetical protein [Clostridium algidicarnis]MBU3196427.1 hypothetical protein [Clostridium algidicarnis]MBU3204041.1 hypothetical protein [Clostridium algidicarnis]